MDVEATYELASGDPVRNNRFLATVTFTQKLAGCFGLRYKLDRSPAAQ